MIPFATDFWILNILLFAVSFYGVVKGSDYFVDAAADLARIWHVSELIIGLTLVGIGTSLPELSSSLYAAVMGEHDFIVGNVLGSCTANITAMLGVAIVAAGVMSCSKKLLVRDLPIMIGAFVLTAILMIYPGILNENGVRIWGLNFVSGIIFLICTAAYLYFLFAHPDELEGVEAEAAHQKTPSVGKALLKLCIGGVLIFVSSKVMVDCAVWIAEQINISSIIISSTIVAFGTSVPELSVTLSAAIKNKPDMAIGNIVGSCIFNILLIFGATALVTPLHMDTTGGKLNMIFLAVSTGALLIFMLSGRTLKRSEGIILLCIYVLFLTYNIMDALGRWPQCLTP